MEAQDTSNLGKALTVLDLEDQFISNGELTKFPLAERGRIANGIIAEKLRLGKWKGVLRMMYGGFGKADALYEGDRNQLREELVRSAGEHPKSGQLDSETLMALSNAGESDLIFKLATNLPGLGYENFNAAVSHVNPDYFNDPEQGAQRKQALHQTAAGKALQEKKYDSAFHHFSQIGDAESIGQVFDAVLTGKEGHFSGKLLEEIALSDPSKEDERLKRVVLSAISEEESLNPITAFELHRKYNVNLSRSQVKALQKKLAESASDYEIKTNKRFADNPEIELMWAKKHARKEPRLAYNIFRKQGFDGALAVKAVQAGLSLERYQNQGKTLDASEVSEAHLKRAYQTASFDVKVKIASHLKDSEELKMLSGRAQEKGDLTLAYRLWIAGGGGFEGGYIDGIRTGLIADSIKNHSGTMYFLDRADKKGRTEACDALMQAGKGEGGGNLRQAYEIALELGDEERTQRAREEIVAVSPAWAVGVFTRTESNDQKGLDYVLEGVASQHGVEPGQLKRIVEKYQHAG